MSGQFFPYLNGGLSLRHAFWFLIGCHLVLWTLVPLAVSPNAPLDVIEGYVWGHEWLMGTYKHPPMQAWLLEILAWLTGRAQIAHFLASQLAVTVAFWAVWRVGLRILDPLRALLGVLLLEGIVYYNFTSVEFNPNVLQLPFWALVGLSYHRAIRGNNVIDWLLLGLWSAGGLYTKYSTVLLLAALAILTLARPESRRRLAQPGPYIAFLVAFILFVPHLRWLIDHDFLPFTYAQERLHGPEDRVFWHALLVTPVLFIGGQLLAALPGLLLFLCLFSRKALQQPRQLFTNFDKAFLWTITFGPCFLVLTMTVLMAASVHSMWATPFWNFLGLWALAYFQPSLSPRALRRFTAFGGVVAAGILCAYIGGTFFYPYIKGRGLRIDFPGPQIADAINTAWTAKYHKPLPYVVGDTWLAGNIAYYSPSRPHVFINGDRAISPWADHGMVDRQGGVLVWCIEHCSFSPRIGEMPGYGHDFTIYTQYQEPLEFPRQTGAHLPPVKIGWAILPPG